MATMNFVRTRLMPGVQSIEVLGEGSMGNWVPVDRVVEGRRVKFTVTTYPNFILTSWRAYFADAYGNIIDLPLTSVTGESSWIFTMPDSLVMILCEASGSSGGSIIWPEYEPTGVYTITSLVTLQDCIDVSFSRMYTNEPIYYMKRSGAPTASSVYITKEEWWSNFLSLYPSLGQYFDLSDNTRFKHVYLSSPNGGSDYNHFYSSKSQLSLPSDIRVGNAIPGAHLRFTVYRYNNHLGNTGYAVWFNPIDWAAEENVYFRFGVSSNGQYASNLMPDGYGPTQPSDIVSIRYILSPTESGEIDASAPSELTGESSFTFKYRIKANYVFKRLTPFALNNVYYESEIVYAIDSYDGDTRTYTFTVSQIPEGATGVNVVIEAIRTDDPNDVGGTNASDTSVGGDGTYDDTSDHISLPSMPSGISAADSGLVTLFRPSIAQVKDFGDYLWSNLTEFIENLQKLFTSPMDYIIAFNILPVSPSAGADKKIYIGNWLSTIEMPPVLNQFYEFNAGTVQIKEYFGSFLDYAPNSRARIMLPFIGDRDLAVNEIMGKTLQLWYRIDLLSGACVAILNINDEPFYQWSGNCAVAIPVTSSDWSRLYGAIARVATIGAGFAFLGAGGAMTTSVATSTTSGAGQGKALGEMARAFNNAPKGVSGVARERSMLLSGMENVSAPETKTITSNTSRAISGTHLGAILGHNMMGAVPRIQHTGDMSGAISIMGNRTPYIVLEYPNVNLPDNYKHIYGYPSNQYAVLGNLSGFTKCKEVLFESGSATDDEIEMVVNALKGGVYL